MGDLVDLDTYRARKRRKPPLTKAQRLYKRLLKYLRGYGLKDLPDRTREVAEVRGLEHENGSLELGLFTASSSLIFGCVLSLRVKEEFDIAEFAARQFPEYIQFVPNGRLMKLFR